MNAAESPRPVPWWLGPLGVLLGVFAAFAILTFGLVWNFPAALAILAFVPALAGYALMVARNQTALNLLTSTGTGFGWILLISLMTSPLCHLQAISSKRRRSSRLYGVRGQHLADGAARHPLGYQDEPQSHQGEEGNSRRPE